jgi:hypothetical protein
MRAGMSGNARAAMSGAVVQGGKRATDGAEDVKVAADGGGWRRTAAHGRRAGGGGE